MNVFKIQSEIINEYKEYITSFINIKNDEIRIKVEGEIASGKLWPEPRIQFNPAFEYGDSIKELCNEGLFHPEIEKIFQGYSLYRHQVDAIKKGINGNDFVVTSGTGSGKSLIFLGTIFNQLLKKNNKEKGIKAIIVYPMNALINSQNEEISRYKGDYEEKNGKEFPITYAQYTGQEDNDERERIKSELPDIILTNYMMLELILTRTGVYGINSELF